MRIEIDYIEHLFVFLRVLIIVVVEQQMKFVIDQRKVIKIILIEFFRKLFLVITFTDLAGHTKYMKTTIFGLSAHAADFAMLCVDAPSSVGMYIEF
jgi:GTPase